MRYALLPLLLLVAACDPVPDFKPMGSVSYVATPSAFGHSGTTSETDPMAAPMIVLANNVAPECGSEDVVTLSSSADRVLVINLYDASDGENFAPVTPGDYSVGSSQGRLAVANYFERCAESPFNFDAASGTVHVTHVDSATRQLEGTYSILFAGKRLSGSFKTSDCGAYDSALTWARCE